MWATKTVRKDYNPVEIRLNTHEMAVNRLYISHMI